jgi:RNA polymerase sigma factor (sigma-70 family)
MRDDRFEELYREHAAAVYRFLAYRTGDQLLAEDLLADVFERVLVARRPRTLRIRDEKAWIFTVALNRLRDHARRDEVERRAIETTGREARPDVHEDDLDAFADRAWLSEPLRRLSPEEREAIALRYGADLTAPQIATATGASLTTVEGRIYRALRKLRADLTAPSSNAAEGMPM